jgi:ABC-type sugar transport system ATPase subunit
MMRLLRVVREAGGSRALLILDEPTAAVSPKEIEPLFEVVRRIARSDGAIIFISHKIDEVIAISDSITCLRAGSVIATVPSKSVTVAEVMMLMSGRKGHKMAEDDSDDSRGSVAGPMVSARVLDVRNVSGEVVHDTTLHVDAGQIVGLAGLSGMGQNELLSIVAGIRQAKAGSMMLMDRPYAPRSVKEAWERGVRLVPADRRRQGLWLEGTVGENLTIGDVDLVSIRGRINRKREDAVVRKMICDLQIRPQDPSFQVSRLSGGNQQKVLFGRIFLASPTLILLDQPTEGVDPLARLEILGMVRGAARASNAGVLVLSSEFDELTELCDTVYVFRHGQVISKVHGGDVRIDRLEELAQGGLGL